MPNERMMKGLYAKFCGTPCYSVVKVILAVIFHLISVKIQNPLTEKVPYLCFIKNIQP